LIATPPASAATVRPLFDADRRRRAAQVLLGLAAVLAVTALARPLAPHRPVWLRAAVLLLLAGGTAASAILTSLRGRGRVDPLALYAFLVLVVDGAGQMLAPHGWPVWPAMALLLASIAVAEAPTIALGIAALAAVLEAAQAANGGTAAWKPALVASMGYGGLVYAIHRALLAEKQRLGATLTELARLRHGIDHLDDTDGAHPRLDVALPSLPQVSEEERRARQMERAEELDAELQRLVHLARLALSAHSVLLFSVDRERETACLRAADGPDTLRHDVIVPVRKDPFAFVVDRGQSFYLTDFKRVLWTLPYYRGEIKIGSLLAAPVYGGETVTGVLVADRLETQSLTGGETQMLEAFAEMAAGAFSQARELASRKELGSDLEVVYRVSQDIASMEEVGPVCRRLLSFARQRVPLEGGAVVLVDDAQTRYVVEAAFGWAEDYHRREVAIDEKTWVAWAVRGGDPLRLEDVGSEEKRMPVLVLDEDSRAGEALLVLPFKTRERALGAVILTAARRELKPSATRVVEILVNQAAALLSTLQLAQREREMARRDPLTGLLNRRAFAEQLGESIARHERQGGDLCLLMLDLDYFKKLNDTFGHLAGDAALKNAASLLRRQLRSFDVAARYGGEEFVVMLSGANEGVALQIAERIRSVLEKAVIEFGGVSLRITASLGLAVWPEHGRRAEDLLGAADRALYAAKDAGRNRVIRAPRTIAEAPSPEA
jgi:diguanylate cyclase (GGDEF)-like protein